MRGPDRVREVQVHTHKPKTQVRSAAATALDLFIVASVFAGN